MGGSRDKEEEQRRGKEKHRAGSDEKGQMGERQEGERHPQQEQGPRCLDGQLGAGGALGPQPHSRAPGIIMELHCSPQHTFQGS